MGSHFRRRRLWNVLGGAYSFNQDNSSWDVSSVSNMGTMFHNASSFNQDLSSWDLSNVALPYSMFRGARSFNQDISSWLQEASTKTDHHDREMNYKSG
jgi:surface protein